MVYSPKFMWMLVRPGVCGECVEYTGTEQQQRTPLRVRAPVKSYVWPQLHEAL